MTTFPITRVSWSNAYCIVPSRYPPIHLFERITRDPAEWDLLADIEMITNPRIRDEIGEIRLVPAEERVSGAGATWVMAPFTHLNPRGSRFSDGTYGIYYAADRIGTAVQETVHHMRRFYADSGDQPHDEDMRVLVGAIDGWFYDLVGAGSAAVQYLDPTSYVESQELGRAIRDEGRDGLHYPSVRNPPHPCVAAFRPKIVGIPARERHLKYHWDSRAISRVFDYSVDRWIDAGAYR